MNREKHMELDAEAAALRAQIEVAALKRLHEQVTGMTVIEARDLAEIAERVRRPER